MNLIHLTSKLVRSGLCWLRVSCESDSLNEAEMRVAPERSEAETYPSRHVSTEQLDQDSNPELLGRSER